MSQPGEILSRLAQAAETAAESFLGHIQPARSVEGPLWAKAQSNWHNAAGNGSYVECHPCSDYTGSDADTGLTVRVYLPRATNTDPNVVAGQVIGYTRAASGVHVASTGYLDDAIGTIKLWSANTGDPPAGWSECKSGGSGNVTGLEGRFPVGKYASLAAWDTVNKTGGTRAVDHCHAVNIDASSPPCTPGWLMEGDSYYRSISTAKTVSPPYCVVRFIERIDNSS